MEKLLKLLQQYEKERESIEGYPIYNWEYDEKYEYFVAQDDYYGTRFKSNEAIDIICSRNYEFIKRLRENDHLDLTKVDKREQENQIYFDISDGPLWAVGILSIMKDKIGFLISILM